MLELGLERELNKIQGKAKTKKKVRNFYTRKGQVSD